MDALLMTIICAWCGKRLGEKDGAGETHGICAECKADLFKEDDDGKL